MKKLFPQPNIIKCHTIELARWRTAIFSCA